MEDIDSLADDAEILEILNSIPSAQPFPEIHVSDDVIDATPSSPLTSFHELMASPPSHVLNGMYQDQVQGDGEVGIGVDISEPVRDTMVETREEVEQYQLQYIQKPAEEDTLFTQDCTELYINREPYGVGIIYLTTREIVWISDDQLTGVCLIYTDIQLHALVGWSDTPFRSLYIIHQNPVVGSISHDGGYVCDDDGDSDDDSGGDQINEVRFVPSDQSSLHGLYEKLKIMTYDI